MDDATIQMTEVPSIDGEQINQCDGCRRGLKRRRSHIGDSVMHDGPDGMPVMICTAEGLPVPPRPYINDPHWRTVMEAVNNEPWWKRVLGALFFVFVMLPVLCVMRLFGYRPRED